VANFFNNSNKRYSKSKKQNRYTKEEPEFIKKRRQQNSTLQNEEIKKNTSQTSDEAFIDISQAAKKKTTVKKQSFIQGAMILGMSMVIVKIMGMIYKILFANIVDGVGYGMFNNAYELYNPLFMLATAGFPIAISRMVSESVAQHRYNDIKKIHRISIPFFITSGILCFVAMIAGGFLFVQVINSQNTIYAIIMLAPTILFGCLMSIYRGYFEGLRNMTPTAISEIIEAAGKLFVGLCLAYFVNNMCTAEFNTYGTILGEAIADYETFNSLLMGYTVAAAFMGIALGSFFGFIFLLLRYKFKGDGITRLDLATSPPARSGKSLIKQLATTAIPIGLGAIVMSISGNIDSILVQTRILDIMNNDPQILQNIYGFLDASRFATDSAGDYSIQTYLFGCYGYALTLMMLITAVTQVFGTSALPSITTAWTARDKGQLKKGIETVLRSTMLFTLPAGLGMSVLATPILSLIYNKPDEIQIASGVLQVMGISVIFIATSTPICSMLQAVGRMDLPLKLLTVGMIIKIILNYTLVGIPSINIQGATVGSLVGYLFITVVGLYFLCKETKILPNFAKILVKPLISAVCCAAAAWAGYGLASKIIPSKISTVFAILVAGIVYIMVLFLTRGISKEDIQMLPKGNKIAKVLEKRHLIR